MAKQLELQSRMPNGVQPYWLVWVVDDGGLVLETTKRFELWSWGRELYSLPNN